jgi:transposase
MDEISTIGLDIAKNVFQVHGVDGNGAVVVRRQLRRAELLKFFGSLPACTVGIEACATSHHWARQIAELGHRVRLLPPAHVKPYVKRGKKNDAADAAAICEAVTRPHMRNVPVKTEGQQAVLLLHRARDLLVRQRADLEKILGRPIARRAPGRKPKLPRDDEPGLLNGLDVPAFYESIISSQSFFR